MRILITCWCLLGVVMVGRAVADHGELAALQGTWKVTDIAVNGKPAKDPQQSNGTLTFSGGELVMEPGDGSQKERFKVRLEAGSVPPALHVDRIEPANRPQSGWQLYEVKDGRLRIAFFDALQGRPTSFEPQPKLIVLELKKAAAK